MVRPTWDEWALDIAKAIARRGDCTRRQVGAVILDKDHRIIGAGYNGSYPGGPSCLAGDCPRGRHYAVEYRLAETGEYRYTQKRFKCGCGGPWPCEAAVAPSSSYDTGPGACLSVHAELNAALDVADRTRLVGSTMYITDAPCDGCLKILKNTAITRIVWPEGEIVKWES